MVLFRAIGVVLALAFLLCLAAHALTGQPVWRQRAMVSVKWGVVLGMCFLGYFVLRRAAMFV